MMQKKTSTSSAINRPYSGLSISSDLFYIDQSVFLHSRGGMAIVFTSDWISVSHTSSLPPLSSLICLFNVDICKCRRQGVISWPKLSREKIILRVSTKKVTLPSLWGTSCGLPFFPEWTVELLLTYDINTMNILMLWLWRPFVALLQIARVCILHGLKISRTAAQNCLTFNGVWWCCTELSSSLINMTESDSFSS
jgi:hypothetical protein